MTIDTPETRKQSMLMTEEEQMLKNVKETSTPCQSSHKINKPKRPLSAYNLFFRDERAAILRDEGFTSFGQLGKMIGERWNAISPPVKSKYEIQAKLASDEYKLNLKMFHEQEDAMLLQMAHEIEVKKKVESNESPLKRARDDDNKQGNIKTRQKPLCHSRVVGKTFPAYEAKCDSNRSQSISVGATSLCINHAEDAQVRKCNDVIAALLNNSMSPDALTSREARFFQQGFLQGVTWRRETSLHNQIPTENILAAQLKSMENSVSFTQHSSATRPSLDSIPHVLNYMAQTNKMWTTPVALALLAHLAKQKSSNNGQTAVAEKSFLQSNFPGQYHGAW